MSAMIFHMHALLLFNTSTHKNDFTTTLPPSTALMPSLSPPPLFLPDSYSLVDNNHRFCRLSGGGRGEMKVSSLSSSSLLLSSSLNKFGMSARTITTTPRANTQANNQANTTTNPQNNTEVARRRWRGQQGEMKESSSSSLLS